MKRGLLDTADRRLTQRMRVYLNERFHDSVITRSITADQGFPSPQKGILIIENSFRVSKHVTLQGTCAQVHSAKTLRNHASMRGGGMLDWREVVTVSRPTLEIVRSTPFSYVRGARVWDRAASLPMHMYSRCHLYLVCLNNDTRIHDLTVRKPVAKPAHHSLRAYNAGSMAERIDRLPVTAESKDNSRRSSSIFRACSAKDSNSCQLC